MKIPKFIFILLAILACALPLLAQPFQVTLNTQDPITFDLAPLDSLCGGTTHRIADGTNVEVWWDLDPAGPSANDVIAPLCDGAPDCIGGAVGSLNRNVFQFNGEAMIGDPSGRGCFFMTDYLASFGGIATPCRYYLKVCLDPSPHRYYSRSLTFTAGQIGDLFLGASDWTCVDSLCGGCAAPAPASAFVATDSTTCNGVVLTWTYGTDPLVDGFQLFRDNQLLTTVGPTVRTYTDATALSGNRYQYSIKAHSSCGRVSVEEFDYGSVFPPPPVPQNVGATVNICDSVRVNWTFTSAAGVDSFVIFRGATRVGAIVRPPSIGTTSFAYFTTSPDAALHYVAAKNSICGLGALSTPGATGQALQRPVTVTGIVATQGACDTTVVTWTSQASATSYAIHRANNDGSGDVVIGNVTTAPYRFTDITGVAGTTYRYWVVASNNCGAGPAAAFVTGWRNVSPTQPLNVSATDSTLCDRVTVTWSDVATDTCFYIYRQLSSGGAIDSFRVTANVVTYDDMTAVQGSLYNYWVKARNACGFSIASTTNPGSRKPLPGQVTGVVASDSSECLGVTIAWANIANEDSFVVLRNATRIGAVAANILTFSDTSAVRGTVYTYTVQAKNNCGNGVVSAGDTGSRKRLPGQPTGLTASTNSCTAITLNWTNGIATDSIQIYRAPGTYLLTVPATPATYADTAAPSGNSSYYLVPKNTCGVGPQSAPNVQGTRLPPLDAVSSLGATMTNCTQVVVTWTATQTPDSFQIRRNGVRIASVPAGTFTYNDATGNVDETYQYTVVAYNLCGAGGVATAVNGLRPSGVTATGLTATINSCVFVDLNWTDPANEDSIVIKRDGVRLAKVLANVTNYHDSTAVPGTVYSYTITGYNLCGAGGESTPATGSKVILPSIPAGLTASTTNCAEITLNWTASTGDVFNYEVFRNNVSLGTVANNVTVYHDLTATPGVVYAYTIKANSTNCGPSLASASANGYQPAIATVPTGVAATATRCDSVVITWTASTGHITHYEVYADNNLIYTTPDSIVLRYAYVPAVGSYSYTVKAFSTECGMTAASTPATGGLLAYPTSASGLTATVNRCDGVNLSWTAGTGDIAGYQINRDGNLLTTVLPIVLTYSDLSVPDENTHSYTIISHSNNCGNAVASDAATGQKLPAPTPPAGIAADTTRCDSVIVTWTASSGTFTQYRLFRNHILLAEIPAGTTHYGDAPTSGVTYRYTVAAVDPVCGQTDTLNGANGRRQADASVPQDLAAAGNCDAVRVTWHASTGGLAHYILYRDNAFLATVLPPDTFYDDASAVRGQTYSYKVSAFSVGCGETAFSNSSSGMRLPLLTAVTGLEASQDNCLGIYIEWASLSGAAKYFIYRDDVLLDSVDASARNDSYIDTSALPRSVHAYKVAASNACGVGAQSEPASGHRNDVPDVPATLTASGDDCAAIHLTWSATTNTHNYRIVRDGTDSVTVDSTVLSYTDTPVAGTHTYVVKSVNACGASAPTAQQTGYRIPGVTFVSGTTTTQDLCERIIFSWTDLPNESGYMVYRSDTLIATTDSNVISYTDTLMSPGSHNYKVKAFNICGEGPFLNENTGISHTIPPRVASATASRDSCSSILVRWTLMPTAEYYLIYRNSVRLDSVGASVDSLWDQGLTPGEYHYLIQTGNFCGRGGMSDTDTGRVADVPPVVENFTASSNSCVAINLNWNLVAASLHYEIFRDDALLATVPRDSLHYADISATPGTHSYTIRATNICGIGNATAPVSGELHGVPLAEPAIIAPDTACDGTVILHWSIVPDANSIIVYRDSVAIDSVAITAESFVDQNIPAGMHRYMLQSRNECGRGPVPVLFHDVLFIARPGTPTGLTATMDNCLTVTINWTDVLGETGYKILREGEVAYDTIGTVGEDVTSFGYSPPFPGTFVYKVVAVNHCGLGTVSDPVTGRRRGAPGIPGGLTATNNHCDNIVVGWAEVTDAEYYLVYRGATLIDSVLAGTLTVTDVPAPGTYNYFVIAGNACGQGGSSAAVSGRRITIPGPVTGFTASANTCDGVHLNWTALAEVTYYVVHRDGLFLANVSPDSIHYLDVTAVNNQNYSYALFAHDTCGTSLDSVTAVGHRMQAAQDPVGVSATTTLCDTIRVTWNNAGGDVDFYYVIRDRVTRVATIAAGTTVYNDLITGTHTYGVIAGSDQCGLSDTSQVLATGNGHAHAGVPTALNATPANCNSIGLTWVSGGGEIDGYYIYRDGVRIDTIGAVTSFTDTTVLNTQNHSYSVSAFNGFCGESAQVGPIVGHLEPLASMVVAIPGDTIRATHYLTINFTFCNTNMDSVGYFLWRGSTTPNYTYLRGTHPVASLDSVMMPEPPEDNVHVKVMVYRRGRADSLITRSFRIGNALAVDDPFTEIPKDFFLDQNYPNPFNPSTVIRFGVPREANITIAIYDIMGRQVDVISDGRMQPGIHSINWDCSACPSGMYIVRFQTGDRTMLRKMLLMK